MKLLRKLIIEKVKVCSDAALLDLILKILTLRERDKR